MSPIWNPICMIAAPDAPVALMEVTSGLMLARTGGMLFDVI